MSNAQATLDRVQKMINRNNLIQQYKEMNAAMEELDAELGVKDAAIRYLLIIAKDPQPRAYYQWVGSWIYTIHAVERIDWEDTKILSWSFDGLHTVEVVYSFDSSYSGGDGRTETDAFSMNLRFILDPDALDELEVKVNAVLAEQREQQKAAEAKEAVQAVLADIERYKVLSKELVMLGAKLNILPAIERYLTLVGNDPIPGPASVWLQGDDENYDDAVQAAERFADDDFEVADWCFGDGCIYVVYSSDDDCGGRDTNKFSMPLAYFTDPTTLDDLAVEIEERKAKHGGKRLMA